jgi:hypothetical protein
MKKVSYSGSDRRDFADREEVVKVAALAPWVRGLVADQGSKESGCVEVNSGMNGVRSARSEELTRLVRASRVKVRANERKKDSDRAALEEE